VTPQSVSYYTSTTHSPTPTPPYFLTPPDSYRVAGELSCGRECLLTTSDSDLATPLSSQRGKEARLSTTGCWTPTTAALAHFSVSITAASEGPAHQKVCTDPLSALLHCPSFRCARAARGCNGSLHGLSSLSPMRSRQLWLASRAEGSLARTQDSSVMF
jgi:hypothetical protein